MNAYRDNKIINFNRKEEKKEGSKGYNQTTRYRAGIKPEWIEDNSSDEDIFKEDIKNEDIVESKNELRGIMEVNQKNDLNKEIIQQIETTDRRLQRLNQVRNKNENKANKNEIDNNVRRRREIFKSEIIQDNKEVQIKNDIDNKHERVIGKDSIDNHFKIYNDNYNLDIVRKEDIIQSLVKQEGTRRRKKIQNMEKFTNDNEDELLELLEEAKESEKKHESVDDNNEYDYDLDDDNNSNQDVEEEEILMRPVFISKDQRKTIQDELLKDQEEKDILDQEEKLKAKRKKHTTELVNKYIQKENKKQSKEDEDLENTKMPDDTDNLDDLEEYEKWKLRELKRIKRQVEEDEVKLKEKLEIERRRKLTNEQRKEENLRLGSDDTLRPFKSKINFMQRFYHKGAFFQQESQSNMDHVFNRDYNMPVAEEKRDLSNLPKILQKRRGNLFKKGQSKYTHLTAEDTTCFDPNFKMPDIIVNKMLNNLGGYKAKDSFELNRNKNR